VRFGPFHLVSAAKKPGQWELYDLRSDAGEKDNLAAQKPELVQQMAAAYDRWWEEVQPCLVNENAIGPAVNPFKALYWKQFGGGPTEALLRQMKPELKFSQ
jgi:arylsulfatase